MNEIINIGVGTDVKLTARLVDAQGNAINLNQVTELRAVIYNGDRQRTLSDYNIVDDTSVEFVLRSGTELTAGDQVAISMAIRYKKDGFVNSTPIIEIINRGWVGEEITPKAIPLSVLSSEITAQFTISVPPAVYYAGASPRIGANGHWYVFDDVTKDYVDTGFGANVSNEQIIADETERRRQEAIRVAAEVQREQRMTDVENKVTDVSDNIGYLREDVDARISTTPDGVEVKGSDDADQEVKLLLSTKNPRPKFVRNNTTKELALKEDVDALNTSLGNSKFDKNKVLLAYPTVEPTDNSTVIPAKAQFKKDKEQDDKMVQLEQEVNLFNKKPQGLRFKAGDNTVFAKTMKALVLGTDDFTVCVVSRGEGSLLNNNPILGYSKANSSPSSMRLYRVSEDNINGASFCSFENANANILSLRKNDTTTNLHHIAIARSGTLVKAVINGRLVKSVTQDRVLDFSNFIYDIANTSYFWGGAVFNYAMTQAESNKLLWNGGRYDEVRLPDIMKENVVVTYGVFASNEYVNSEQISNGYRFSGIMVQDQQPQRPQIATSIKFNGVTADKNYKVYFKFKAKKISGNSNVFRIMLASQSVDFNISNVMSEYSGTVTIDASIIPNLSQLYFYLFGVDKVVEVTDIQIRVCSCLLEYRPENIREDRVINTGTAGSGYDLIYSTVKPEFIFYKPYQDKIVLEDKAAPTDFPIAVGQRCYTNNGSIYEANLPLMGSEWAVSNWKQTNNG